MTKVGCDTPSNCLFLLLPHFAWLHQRCAGACGEQHNKRRLAYLQSPSCTQAQENKAFCGCFKHVWLHYSHDTARHCAGKDGIKLKSDSDKGRKAPVAKSGQSCGRSIGVNARAGQARAFSLWRCHNLVWGGCCAVGLLCVFLCEILWMWFIQNSP